MLHTFKQVIFIYYLTVRLPNMKLHRSDFMQLRTWVGDTRRVIEEVLLLEVARMGLETMKIEKEV